MLFDEWLHEYIILFSNLPNNRNKTSKNYGKTCFSCHPEYEFIRWYDGIFESIGVKFEPK